MRPDIHPEYRQVLFHDLTGNTYFLVGSTLKTDRTKLWEDGKTYPYVTLDVSSASHPFYTGKQKQVSKEGQVAQSRELTAFFVLAACLLSMYFAGPGMFATELVSKHRGVEIHRTTQRTRWTATEDIEQLVLPGDALRLVTTFLEARSG